MVPVPASCRTEPQSLLPSPLSQRGCSSVVPSWLSPMVQLQSLEDSENRGRLGARLFLSRFHHCLNKIKKMCVLPRAKGLSLSEAPSIVKMSTSD